MIMRASPSLRVCIEIEDGRYVAQCVDYDISGIGDSPELAVDAFLRMYMKNILAAVSVGAEPLQNIPAAPIEYVERWRRDVRCGRPVLTRRIPPFKIMKHGQEVSADYFGAIEASIPSDIAA